MLATLFAPKWRAALLALCLAPAPFAQGNDSAAAAETPRRSIIVLGDSIAAGYGVDPGEAFPAILQSKIDAAGLNFEVVNAGLSGDTTAGGLRRVNWVLRRPVDVLLLELGGNDGLRGIPPEETKRNLKGIISRTREKYPQAKIILAGMQMPANMGEEYTEAYQAIFPEVAQEEKVGLIPFLLEGVGGRADMNLDDRIHPTPEGHRVVARNAWQVLRPMLENWDS